MASLLTTTSERYSQSTYEAMAWLLVQIKRTDRPGPCSPVRPVPSATGTSFDAISRMPQQLMHCEPNRPTVGALRSCDQRRCARNWRVAIPTGSTSPDATGQRTPDGTGVFCNVAWLT
jgi:hypothetical protein